MCEIVQCKVITERENPFAHMLGGSLTLCGILKEVKISSLKRSESTFEIDLLAEIIIPTQLDRLLSFVAHFQAR